MQNNHMLSIKDIDVNYTDSGYGSETLILIPGMNQKIGFDKLIPLLAKKVRVLAPDLPGFSASKWNPKYEPASLETYANFIHDFAHTLNIEKYSVFGNSLAGGISLILAYSYPNEINKVIVRSPLFTAKQLPNYFRNPSLLKLYRLLLKNNQSKILLQNIFYRTFDQFNNYNPSTGNSIQSTTLVFEEDVLITLLFNLATTELDTTKLKTISNDVLILWGEQDKLLKYNWAQELKELIPNSIVHSNPTSKHVISAEDPEYLASELLGFIL